MLREIIFCLKRRPGEAVCEKINSAAEYLEEEGFEVAILTPGSKMQGEDDMDWLLSGLSGRAPGDMLIVSDSTKIAEELIENDYYVVGIWHDENQSESFAGLKYVFTDIEEIARDSYEKAYQRYAHLPWEILQTDRCIIRETTVEDVDEFYRLYADPEMTRYMEGLFKNPEDEKRYTRDYIEKVYGLLGFGTWTVIRKEDGKIIGRAGFSVRNGFDDIELGFLIGTEFQRQGYAYEVCRAILDYGKQVLQFGKVQTFVKAENAVSIHLCKKLGFEILEEVDIEENIYGEEYHDGVKVAPSEAKYGKYIRMVLDI
ncbi:GNAT family N-acetyltransferase [Butyrivibrio sp. JL13D10]|uniref:GNAT family N-acetyltransferase n=1 Tax=Butyrivibrio sp. JL13D10 TaxID=3236815 RepID=UPI0038B65ACD